MTELRNAGINDSKNRTRTRRWRALTAASATAAITVAMIVGAAAPPARYGSFPMPG